MLLIILALLAGAILPVQAVVNSALRAPLNSPFWAAFASFFVGTCGLGVYLLLSRTALPPLEYGSVAAWKWTGGLLGAVFVTLTVLLTPRLGAATMFGLVITGQLIASVVLDHFGWLGIPTHTLSVPRAIGVALMLAGVFLVRKF